MNNLMTPMDNEESMELHKLKNDLRQARDTLVMWFEAKMKSHAKFKKGDEIYNIETSKLLGIITEPYFYASQLSMERLLNSNLHIDYYYEIVNRHGIIGNTSSQPNVKFGTKEDVIQYLNNKIEQLETKGVTSHTL